MAVIPKTPEELVIMREAGRINALALQAMREAVRPGVSTQELDRIAADVLHKHNAKAAFLGYPPGSPFPFPATVTASINDELVHGIPSEDRILQEGDIISLDCGAIYKGYVGDSAFTMGVGTISDEAQRLLDVTEAALYHGIDLARAGNETRDISHGGPGVCRGARLQRRARVYRARSRADYARRPPGAQLVAVAAPARARMAQRAAGAGHDVCAGADGQRRADRRPAVLDDHWTVVTADGSLCAHFEHTIAITPEGPPLILTAL